ncbi:DUF2160 domain-containing protein [Pikeienuella piscinae]|uniref:DUF2160 domain-containing protein n=1 Tax=Pikeienuella piscinae TaxID=2748098 RepID=A0A7L5BWQ7_9RHOB|nr:DUF2160 domain-containing protein [Pikeienuella piscinae]QIE54686.1 DUF2160 domain-containing protein [Pikeienuella piscinae]
MRLAIALMLFAAPAAAQKAGWGDVGKEAEKPWSFTDAIAPGFWMAWTNATAFFFILIFASIALMGLLEIRNPGGAPRDGVFGLRTTRGDRLFISLLGAAYIFLAWLGLMGTPLYGALAICALWAAFVFWKV